MQPDFLEGEIILINKPYKWTSFDAVRRISGSVKKIISATDPEALKPQSRRRRFKIGHAGTLDPLATGLLVVCTGKLTKKINEFQDMDKEYTGTFVLGATTASFDMEHEVNEQFSIDHINEKLIHDAAASFVGESLQQPPLFSAVKLGGERAYHFARKGEHREIMPRTITISSFEITSIDMPRVNFKVVCSKGTYIRSLARDFGLALKSGAHLEALCRTRIGHFLIENALTPEEFVQKYHPSANT